MAEFIEREAAMTVPVLPKEYREYQTFDLDDAYEAGWEDALNNLKHIPAADVAPVVHGRWVDAHGDRQVAECSRCKHRYEVTDEPSNAALFACFAHFYRYCPHCGARMDGGEEDG